MHSRLHTDLHRRPGWRTWALLFVLLAVALACSNWAIIQAVNFESSDFAANTLLVLDAKRFHLIYGNYSRVGFNHPGPAILYVLAFGEMLFHDLLHVVPSPFSGQLLAVDLYNAAWLVLIVAMVRRMAGSLVPALLFGAVTMLAFAYSDHAILNGMWFPHLYVLPYAAMLVAISRLVHGRTDALVPLAVASGFLINGHASFVPMLGVILIVVVAANWIIARRDASMRILSRTWFRTHRRAILTAVGILFLFFVPLIIATIKDFPGPIYQYVKFGRGNKGNTIREAAKFVGVYWGLGHGAPARGAVAWGLALVVVLLASLGRTSRASLGFMRDARALGIAFLGGTLALLYYAKVGVDMLDQVYIALFYYAVPALAAALLVLIAWQAIPFEGKRAGAAVLALLAVAGAWFWVRMPPIYIYFYNHANVVTLYEQLRKLPGEGRLVLDLEQNPENWGEIWGNTLGLLAYAKRQGTDLACVNENWHISFTRPNQCRPDEVARNRRYQVRHTDAPDPVRGRPDVEALGLSLFRVGVPPRPFTYVTVKAQPEYFKQILGRGWSNLDGDFVWSDGRAAELNLPAEAGRGRKLTLDLGSFVPGYEVQINVQALVNGKPAGTWAFYATERRRRIVLDLGADPGAAQHIELKIDKPVRPVDHKVGQDTRQLGVSLYGIEKEAQ